MLPENAPVLVASLSARALAQAAVRAGCSVVALDLFNDADTRECTVKSAAVPWQGDGFLPEALLREADSVAPVAARPVLVYGSGFEARPELLEALAARRRLYGNTPATLAAVTDPARFFQQLDLLGIPHPEVRFTAPDACAEPASPGRSAWLVKRAGGSGGLHVRPLAATRAEAPSSESRAHYFQRHQAGDVMSALFFANGREARILGFNHQWTAPCAESPYRWGGAAGNAPLPGFMGRRISEALQELVAATGLRGLNGLDFILNGEDFHVLEVNPRPPATLELYDSPALPLFGLHLRGCRGELPVLPAANPVSRALAVVYAEETIHVPYRFAWPAWCSDLPYPGAAIAPGSPLCTVHAHGGSVAAAKRQVRLRSAGILRQLREKAA